MQEDSGEEMDRSNSPSSDGADPGSNSDEEEQPRSFMSGAQMSSMDMEMSLWSLDASATSSMEASLTAETEVWKTDRTSPPIP